MAVTLILGGARSGKSKHAEYLAGKVGKPVCYVATSPAFEDDAAWQQRIVLHQRQRPKAWITIEEELNIVDILQQKDCESCLLIDCLSLWLSNMMFASKDVEAEVEQLCATLHKCSVEVLLVSNEVGMGIVPETKLGREFRDAQGLLNQKVAAVANYVDFVAAGLPLRLKG